MPTWVIIALILLAPMGISVLVLSVFWLTGLIWTLLKMWYYLFMIPYKYLKKDKEWFEKHFPKEPGY